MGAKLSGAGDGLGSALDAAIEEAGPMLFADPEQVEMILGDGPRDDRAIRSAIDQVIAKSGRPKGSPNKRTAKLRDYLLSRYTHPLEVLAATAAQPDDHLAAELGCSRHEARQLRVRAAGELAPYIESKMPVGIVASGTGHMTMQLVVAGAVPGAVPIADQVDALPIIIGPAAIQKSTVDQGDSDSGGAKSE